MRLSKDKQAEVIEAQIFIKGPDTASSSCDLSYSF